VLRLRHIVTICVLLKLICGIILQNFVKIKDIKQDYDFNDVHFEADYS